MRSSDIISLISNYKKHEIFSVKNLNFSLNSSFENNDNTSESETNTISTSSSPSDNCSSSQ